MRCLPRSACLVSLSLTQSPEFIGPWGMFEDQGQPSLFEDQSLHVSRPSGLCAQAQLRDDMHFHKQAYMEYTQLVFCKLFGRPRERHPGCPTRIQTERQEEKVAENANNKRKWGSNHNGSLSQQNKGHKVPRAHTAWPINKKAHARSLPLCNQCKFPRNGTCTVKCGNCKKVGHIIQNYRTPAIAKNQRTRTCYECGSLRHYKGECPIVKFHERVDMIHERMRTSKPKTMQDAIEIATKLRNKKISTLAECQTENKKRSKPLCSKCNYHHDGPCAPKCHKCNRFGHLARDCRSSIKANTTNTQKALELVRRLHAMNVGIKGTTREIVKSERTKTMKTKSKVLNHVKWCMPLEEEKPNKTLTTLRMRLKLKRESCLT
nr:reverse transcriptase domain-containing protein [Tanacetum cinerariifolium]